MTAKQPWLAVFLSSLLLGVGQIYGGKVKRGICFIILWALLGISVIAGIIYFLRSESAADARLSAFTSIVSAILIVMFSIFVFFDAYKTAKRFNESHNLIGETDVRKKPWLAVFLSSLFPGIGQLYNKQILKGIAFIIAVVSLSAATEYFLPLFLCVVLLDLFSIKDAYDSAERINGSKRTILHQGSRFARILVILIIVINGVPFDEIIKKHYLQAFKLPAGSMIPTLQIGDFILVNKNIDKHRIQRGEIIVFKYPEDPLRDFIKRVIAIGGDRIEIQDKDVYVNDEKLVEPYVQHVDPDIKADQRDNFGSITVPAGSVFVMGDNRDQSYDSRFWGFVPNDNIKGRAFKIYWSWNHVDNDVRWDRLGKPIH